MAVDGKPRSGDRARAQRITVRRLKRRLQSHGVAFELLDDGQQVVRHGGGLRRLGVRVRGHHRLAVPAGQVEQAGAQGEYPVVQRQDELPLAHPVHRHVDVVAAAGRVQPAGDFLAARGGQQALDVEEEVLVGAVVGDARDVFNRDGVQGFANASRVRRSDDRAIGEHRQVRVVNRHQGRDKLPLGVLEVLVEDVLDVFGGKTHRCPVYLCVHVRHHVGTP